MSYRPQDDAHHHDHDLGFAHDLPRLLGRRRFLTVMGGLGLTSLAAPAAAELLTALPWETAGPYPADGTNAKGGQTVNALTQEGIVRTDLRPSFGAHSAVTEGVELSFELTLVDAANGKPLAGHAIYVWHCDATGKYSLYDVTDANWLRGVGIADQDGRVSFVSIYPGCYDGRWPHIHFEVFESAEAAVRGQASVLTAQIALPEAESAEVYAADSRYSNGTRNLGRISIASDNVFADNTADQIAQQTMTLRGSASEGYVGTVTIPIDFNADRSVRMAPPPGGPRPKFGGGRP